MEWRVGREGGRADAGARGSSRDALDTGLVRSQRQEGGQRMQRASRSPPDGCSEEKPGPSVQRVRKEDALGEWLRQASRGCPGQRVPAAKRSGAAQGGVLGLGRRSAAAPGVEGVQAVRTTEAQASPALPPPSIRPAKLGPPTPPRPVPPVPAALGPGRLCPARPSAHLPLHHHPGPVPHPGVPSHWFPPETGALAR